jgi:DNA polymerase/3'-5' exonuclease PolX
MDNSEDLDSAFNIEPEIPGAKKYPLEEARNIAEKVLALIKPHCYRAEIAGSIRRKKAEVKDIEIVAIPKPYELGLFASGIATVVNQWQKVKGELPCKYTQRVLPEGIKLDLFFAEEGNWGLIYALRTGSADYSHYVLASGWAKLGFKSNGGYLGRETGKFLDEWETKQIREEQQLFELLGIPYVEPEHRN